MCLHTPSRRRGYRRRAAGVSRERCLANCSVACGHIGRSCGVCQQDFAGTTRCANLPLKRQIPFQRRLKLFVCGCSCNKLATVSISMLTLILLTHVCALGAGWLICKRWPFDACVFHTFLQTIVVHAAAGRARSLMTKKSCERSVRLRAVKCWFPAYPRRPEGWAQLTNSIWCNGPSR